VIWGDIVAQVALVMPMAGRGSRFSREGAVLPKPLTSLWGQPFFWWAAESARRAFNVGEMVFVVLEEHVRDFAIDRHIGDNYPQARIAVCPEVTSGAAETAKLGVEMLEGDGPVIVNDSDHAFAIQSGAEVAARLHNGTAAALLTFESVDPAYSYARLDGAGAVTGTVEKQVVSKEAIAGAYLFAGASAFLGAYRRYEADCPYDEVFVSGLYNHLNGAHVACQRLDRHISFGTPAERSALEAEGPHPPWTSWL
jgi:NDP-sugar pyrophosphorylase family protein